LKNFLEYKILPSLINILSRSLKIEIINKPSRKNAVYIFWHSQMLAGWFSFREEKSAALVSQSKDGEILSTLLNKWSYKVIRGSSSKGGKEALTELIQLGKNGYNIVITPDGPRGPMNEIKNGALITAYECKIPIIPVRIEYTKKKILEKSWDKFQIPYPFSKCKVIFGDEYFYNEYLNEEKLTDFKTQLKSDL